MNQKNTTMHFLEDLHSDNASLKKNVSSQSEEASLICLDLAGMRSQGMGIAERCGLKLNFLPITPNFLQKKIPSQFWVNPHKTVQYDNEKQSSLIISVGGTGGRVGHAIKKTSLKKPVLIQIQNPRLPLDWFDVVIANYHDEVAGSNVVLTRTAMHRVSSSVLREAKEKWQHTLQNFPTPLIAVLLGGNNGRYSFGIKEAEKLSFNLAKIMKEQKAGLVITPSRRTAPEVIEVIRKTLEPMGAWIWDMKGDNPYFGLLACADCIMVTMDSVSMVSEAVATTVPVYIIDLPGRSRRIKIFLEYLQKIKRIRFFDNTLELWPTEKIDDTEVAANYIKEKFLK